MNVPLNIIIINCKIIMSVPFCDNNVDTVFLLIKYNKTDMNYKIIQTIPPNLKKKHTENSFFSFYTGLINILTP